MWTERVFRSLFKKDVILVWRIFLKPYAKLTLHCNHRFGPLRTEYTESLLLLRRHFGNWSRGMKSELL
jgi:hypothetical protein